MILSTKLSIEDYNSFAILTKLEYEFGLIKEESTSELLRFTIRHLLNQLSNNQVYHYVEQQEKRLQNNQQQQLVNQVTLQLLLLQVIIRNQNYTKHQIYRLRKHHQQYHYFQLK
jgi:hypothetical protein